MPLFQFVRSGARRLSRPLKGFAGFACHKTENTNPLLRRFKIYIVLFLFHISLLYNPNTMASFGLGRPASASANIPPGEIDSSTPWMAASEGNLALLQASLTTLNLPVTAADENGYTLVHAAVSYNQLEVLQFLLSNGANVNAADNDGDTALYHATAVAGAQFLIQHAKANPNQTNAQGKSPLQAKKEELEEMMQDEDVEDDDDDLEALKEVVKYLSTLAQ
jgi:hypothetical protein